MLLLFPLWQAPSQPSVTLSRAELSCSITFTHEMGFLEKRGASGRIKLFEFSLSPKFGKLVADTDFVCFDSSCKGDWTRKPRNNQKRKKRKSLVKSTGTWICQSLRRRSRLIRNSFADTSGVQREIPVNGTHSSVLKPMKQHLFGFLSQSSHQIS